MSIRPVEGARLSLQDSAATEDALAESLCVTDLLKLRCVEVTLQGGVGKGADIVAEALDHHHVLLMAGVRKRAAQLNQQRLEADPQL